jgi:hypothetical protein
MADTENKPTDGKVSVACKLPAGLTILHDGKSVTLNGSNHDGAIAGFGITKDVNAAWFNDWAETSQHPAVTNGAIFTNSGSKISGEAKEKRNEVTGGFEPLDGSKPMQGIERVEPMGG